MPAKHLYEYAVIRFVPKVEREEFINVGLVLFSKQARYIKARYLLDENKLRLFPSSLDADTLRRHLDLFTTICSGKPEGGPVARFDIPERFRWLTAQRSTSIQTSRPHAGLTADLDATFNALFDELVR